jgi:hypothetical protein
MKPSPLQGKRVADRAGRGPHVLQIVGVRGHLIGMEP